MTKLVILSNLTKSYEENLPQIGNPERTLETRPCSKYEDCSCQICPYFGYSGEWFPDEEICNSREFSHELLVRQMKKIAKKVKNTDFYFTYEMLKHDCIITAATEGIDPNTDPSLRETLVNRWLKKHPEKKAKTKEELELLRNRLADFRKISSPVMNDESAVGKANSDTKPLSFLQPMMLEQYESTFSTDSSIVTLKD
jgi:hypothetical protein